MPLLSGGPGAGRFFVSGRAGCALRKAGVKTRTPFEDKLLGLIEPVAADLDFRVVRVRVHGGAKRQRLQVMAEREDGTMNVDDCARLSRALSAVIDVEDPFTGEWDLEVSSPGMDRPLTSLGDFAEWAGYEARLELDRMAEGRKRFTGTLVGIEDENVLIDLKGEDGTAVIPYAWIAEAKLILTDALVAESLKRRDAAAPQTEPETKTAPSEDQTAEEQS
jgi:ribosome maturation factor RimP